MEFINATLLRSQDVIIKFSLISGKEFGIWDSSFVRRKHFFFLSKAVLLINPFLAHHRFLNFDILFAQNFPSVFSSFNAVAAIYERSPSNFRFMNMHWGFIFRKMQTLFIAQLAQQLDLATTCRKTGSHSK